MKYFDILPKIKYEFSSGLHTIPDLFSRVAFTEDFLSDLRFVYQQKQENILRPENLAFNQYNSFDFYWLLLLANNIYDVNKIGPKLQESFGLQLDKLNLKQVYYLYENADIVPYDIFYLSETSYGIIESWNSSYKELVIRQSFNLPTSNLTNSEFYIKRIINNSPINIKNYCSTETFTCFGTSNYKTSINKIYNSSKNLNPFLKVESGNISNTGELLIDTCDASDKTAFQSSLIYKLVNNQNVNDVRVQTKEQELLKQYSNSLNINLLQPDIISALESKIKIMINDRSETANSIIRIG